MSAEAPKAVTRLLRDVRAGEAGAAETLLPLVYAELRGLARAHFSDERHGHTLQPTALVHEAWLKLTDHLDRLENRKHFFAVASQAMRHVLSDYARGRNRQKRGGGQKRVSLDEDLGVASETTIETDWFTAKAWLRTELGRAR